MRRGCLYFFTARKIILTIIILLICNNTSALAKQRITIMLIPMQSPSTMYKNFLPLKRYLEDTLNVTIVIKVARKTSDIIQHLKKGEADIAYLCPTLYCVAYKQMPIVPLVKLRVNGRSEYRSVLLVRNDSPIKKTADLFDRTFVYGRYYCPGSGLLPKIMLQRVDISDNDFLDVVKLGSDESAIIAVMARMFDATGVPEMAAKSYLDKGLRVLSYSYSIPQYLFVARASLGKDFIQRLKTTMLSINTLTNRKEILGSIEAGADGFAKAEDSDYDIVRVLMKNVLKENYIVPPKQKRIKFVVEPVSFEPDVFKQLNPLMTYLSRMTGISFQLVIPGNIETFIQILKTGKGDFFLQSYHLYSEFARAANVKEIASLSAVDHPEDMGIIITHSEGNIRTLQGLSNKKIGIISLHSDGSYLAQRELLKEKGIPLNPKQFVKLKTYEDIIMQVYRGSIDAGFVNYSSLRSMQQDIDMSRIVILAKTPPLPDRIIAARKDMDTRSVNKVAEFLVQFSHGQNSEEPGNFKIKALKNRKTGENFQ